MSATPAAQDDLLRLLTTDHSAHGGELCAFGLVDLDDFHGRVGSLSDQAKASLLQTIFKRIRTQLPTDWSIYRHGRDSLLVASWGSTSNAMLSALHAWRDKFTSTGFALPSGKTVTFEFTVAVGEFPAHGESLRDVLRALEDTLFAGKGEAKGRVMVVVPAKMVLKTSYYTPLQLRRLSHLANELGVTEAELLREALDEIIRKYHS